MLHTMKPKRGQQRQYLYHYYFNGLKLKTSKTYMCTQPFHERYIRFEQISQRSRTHFYIYTVVQYKVCMCIQYLLL